MVEYTSRIDDIFAALADPVRRDIMERTTDSELTVNAIALEYDMSLAAVSKHIKLLLEAGLVSKRRSGRYQLVRATKSSVNEALEYLEQLNDRSNSASRQPTGYETEE